MNGRRSSVNSAIAGWSAQKLRAYSGQKHAQSIESYLGDAESHDPAESIFCHPPARVRHAPRREPPAKAAEEPGVTVVQQPAIEMPNSRYLN